MSRLSFSALHVCANAALQLPGSRTTQEDTDRKVSHFVLDQNKNHQSYVYMGRRHNHLSLSLVIFFFLQMLNCQQTTPFWQIISGRRCLGNSYPNVHLSISWNRFIFTVFMSLDWPCFCLAFSSCLGNAATRLAALEINSKSRHANKAGVVFICGDLVFSFAAPDYVWCEWVNYL